MLCPMQIYPMGKHGMSTCDIQTTDKLLPVAENVKDWLPALKKWLKLTLELG